MSLLWRSIHCRERRKVEEYSSLEVTDSDNNSIKDLLNFLSLLSERIFQNLLEVVSESELHNSHSLLEVTSEFECRNLTSECRRLIVVVLCVLIERNGALFIALREG